MRKMRTMRVPLWLLVVCARAVASDDAPPAAEGCFLAPAVFVETRSRDAADCVESCRELFFGFALMRSGACVCANVPGTRPADPSACESGGATGAALAYKTGVVAPGPPTDVSVSNVTETSVELSWSEPEAKTTITGYEITATVVATHSPDAIGPKRLLFSRDTFRSELTDLHPGTSYEVSVRALSPEGPGAPARAAIETRIGEPEPAPRPPEIVKRRGDRMVVRIPKAVNVNGPVTRYRLVVVDEDKQRGFIPDLLGPFEEAAKEGLSYYVTAELDPDEIEHDFVIGNGKVYDNYYNAPLPRSQNVRISVGVVSEKNGVSKVRYAQASDVLVLRINEEETVSPLVMTLGVAIAVGLVLLLIGIGAAIVLRRRVAHARRRRLASSMQMSPRLEIEIENAGFVADEDDRPDPYSDLKRRLWNIPRNFLEVDGASAIGTGSFGPFVRGRVQHQGAPRQCSVQEIAERRLSRADRRAMLAELDSLIKTDGHENVVSLIGVCELPETLYVVLEDTRQTLKELLVSSRRRDVGANKFCPIDEAKVFRVALDLAKAMVYISNQKVSHKRLCCRNVLMANGTTPKIGGFGLSHYHIENEKPDYVRWTAHEMFKQNTFLVKSDVWSFGCLLWELLSLGGTPYPQVSSRDVPLRVSKGMRPAQLSYVGDELYQICLHCWELDPDERPTFPQILINLEAFTVQNTLGLLSFTYFNGFDYEPYYPELEILT